MPKINLLHSAFWTQKSLGEDRELWVRGEPYNLESSLNLVPESIESPEDLKHFANAMDGFFTIIMKDGESVYLISDRIRSHPLFIDREFNITDTKPRNELTSENEVAALSLAMAGYTIGSDTIWDSTEILNPGEIVKVTMKSIQRNRYYRYLPVYKNNPYTSQDLINVLEQAFKKMVERVGDRQIAIPLSGGNDSRVVLALTKKFAKADQVVTFSYGQAGNHEAETARKLAAKAELPWHFCPLSFSGNKQYFQTQKFKDYLTYSDCGNASPHIQEILAIDKLIEDKIIKKDACVINGNTGDFISGGHVASPLVSSPTDVDSVIKEYIYKHFSLWQGLHTKTNLEKISNRLNEEINLLRKLSPEIESYGLFEAMEYENRQVKYVIHGQRVYEFFGLSWMLPLWDKEVMDFFQGVSPAHKLNQQLYKDTLKNNNWYGLWDVPVNEIKIRPLWLIPIRNFFKALHIIRGKYAWYQFDKKYFSFLYNAHAGGAIVPYWTHAMSPHGPRHGLSWYTKNYLENYGIKIFEKFLGPNAK